MNEMEADEWPRAKQKKLRARRDELQKEVFKRGQEATSPFRDRMPVTEVAKSKGAAAMEYQPGHRVRHKDSGEVVTVANPAHIGDSLRVELDNGRTMLLDARRVEPHNDFVAQGFSTQGVEKKKAPTPAPSGKAASLLKTPVAATSQKPRIVLDAIREFYETANANPHRGAYSLSVKATEAYHAARACIARFFGVTDPAAVIFTRGTAESVNLVAISWGGVAVQPGDDVIVTAMDHHGNFVPWQQLAIRQRGHLRIWEMESDGTLDLDRLRALLSNRTAVVAFNHVSKALLTVNPVREIADLAREAGATTVCDGAQSAPHMKVDFAELGVDFAPLSYRHSRPGARPCLSRRCPPCASR